MKHVSNLNLIRLLLKFNVDDEEFSSSCLSIKIVQWVNRMMCTMTIIKAIRSLRLKVYLRAPTGDGDNHWVQIGKEDKRILCMTYHALSGVYPE
jgi:hypothetical protein